jgi:hypothetical protein
MCRLPRLPRLFWVRQRLASSLRLNAVYGNEGAVGASLEHVLRGGVKREELWMTSELWNDKHGEGRLVGHSRRDNAGVRLAECVLSD